MPRVYLSGSSGRYPPRHPRHLEDAERLFSAVGFEVFSLGWDQETDKPRKLISLSAFGAGRNRRRSNEQAFPRVVCARASINWPGLSRGVLPQAVD